MSWQRPDNRQPDQLRAIRFEREFIRFAAGSVLTKCGDTQILCTVTVQPGCLSFEEQAGWLTAEYRMLPALRLNIGKGILKTVWSYQKFND